MLLKLISYTDLYNFVTISYRKELDMERQQTQLGDTFNSLLNKYVFSVVKRRVTKMLVDSASKV